MESLDRNLQNPDDNDDDATHANKSSGFIDVLSSAIQTGIGKGVANSATQATESLIKMFGHSLHIGPHTPATPPSAKPAVGTKPKPPAVHAPPIPAAPAAHSGPHSGGQKPVTNARPAGNGSPHAARPVPQSGQGASPASQHASVQSDGARTSTPRGTTETGGTRRSSAAHVGGQMPHTHPALGGTKE